MKQSHQSNRPDEAVWAKDQSTSESGHVVHGVQVGCGLHVLFIPVLFFGLGWIATVVPEIEVWFALVPVYIGLVQLIYMAPAWFWFQRKDSPKGFQKGLVLSAVALFLLNAGCMGFFLYG
ncbi:MAG: hypothetical protein P1V35_02175 [Planctomycetota bacterium]|nr:hypothetical protein [Planctomycetota bacterium]